MPQDVISMLSPSGDRLPLPQTFHPAMGWAVYPHYLVLIEGVYFQSDFPTEAEFLASSRVLSFVKEQWPAHRTASLFAAWFHQKLDERGVTVLGEPTNERAARDLLVSRGIPGQRARDLVHGWRRPSVASPPGLAAVLEVPVADVYKAAGRESVPA